MADDLTLLLALQNIRFQMDEKGVRLQSEAHMSFGCSAPYNPRPKHEMIFDKPFLIMMMRKDATLPYFALWVANPELLVKAE
jgi:serine protease inhibitor